MPLSKIEWVAA